MMLKTPFLVALLLSSSFALELETIVQDALKENYEIKLREKVILFDEQDIALATTWKDPTFSAGLNDIWFDDPLKRDKEAMQAQFIALSQVVPTNGKLAKKEAIFKEQKEISRLKLEDKKLKLASNIREIGYSFVITQKKIALLKDYQKNTKELEDVAYMLYESGGIKQTVPLNAKLLNSKLKIQMQNLEYKLQSLKLKLEELTYKEIEAVETSLEKRDDLSVDIETHPAILALKSEVKKQNSVAKLKRAEKIPDIKFNVGYFQRDDRNDYLSASINLPLPIRGIQEKQESKAKYKALMGKDKLESLKITFKSKVDLFYEQMQTAYNNYEILQNDMKGQKEYIGQNLALHAQLGHLNSIDLIQNINETISLEMLALDELNNYFSSYAKSLYFKGEL